MIVHIKRKNCKQTKNLNSKFLAGEEMAFRRVLNFFYKLQSLLLASTLAIAIDFIAFLSNFVRVSFDFKFKLSSNFV